MVAAETCYWAGSALGGGFCCFCCLCDDLDLHVSGLPVHDEQDLGDGMAGEFIYLSKQLGDLLIATYIPSILVIRYVCHGPQPGGQRRGGLSLVDPIPAANLDDAIDGRTAPLDRWELGSQLQGASMASTRNKGPQQLVPQGPELNPTWPLPRPASRGKPGAELASTPDRCGPGTEIRVRDATMGMDRGEGLGTYREGGRKKGG